MSLDAQCARCQGFFRNFQQIVRRDAGTYCAQCDAAIKRGEPDRMYSEQLPGSCIFDYPSAGSHARRGDSFWVPHGSDCD